MMESAGQTAPRLIAVLKHTDRRLQSPSERNPFTHKPRGYDERFDANRVEQSVLRACKHYWTTQQNQTVLPEDDATPPPQGTQYRVGCFCQHCRWHVDITVVHQGNSCPMEDFPLHHFIDFKQANPECQYYSAKCSGCEAGLHIEYRAPRLTPQQVALLTDPVLLSKRAEAAKRADPERTNFQSAHALEVLDALSCYIRDSLDDVAKHRSIPRLNRRFLLSFGEDCDLFLTSIGFVQTEAHWELPQPPDPNPWGWDSRKTLQDIQEELWALTRLNMPPAYNPVNLRAYAAKPGPSDSDLHQLLATLRYESTRTSRRTPMLSKDEEIWYTALGTLGDFSDDLLRFAFDRQVACDPAGTPFYFDCFKKLANKRNSEKLQTDAAILESEGYFTKEDVANAYRYFTMDPRQANVMSDDQIRGMFETRLTSSAAWQEHEIREKLRIIALARGSTELQDVAANNISTAESALKWLGAGYDGSSNLTDEQVVNYAAVKKADNPSSEHQEQIKRAVQLIADARNSDYLRMYAATGEMPVVPDPEEALTKAFNFFGITDRSITPDKGTLEANFHYLVNDNPSQAAEIQKHYDALVHHYWPPDGAIDYAKADYTNPIGLVNIGNTCYLNSLLQYFFAIKPFRDLVLNYDLHKQEIGPNGTKYGKVVTEITEEHVLRAQEFVPELALLFKQMATRPQAVPTKWELASLALEKDSLAKEEKPAPAGEGSDCQKLDGEALGEALRVQNRLSPTPESVTVTGDAASDITLIGDTIMTPESETDENQNGDAEVATSQGATTADDAPRRDSMDAQPVGPPSREPPPIPPRPSAAPEQTVKSKTESYAAQQDVHEVIGNILFKMQCGISADRIDQDGTRHTQIRDLFFHNKIICNLDRTKEDSTEPGDTFFVPTFQKPPSVQAALDLWFGLDDTNRYSTATYLPPLLQIVYNKRFYRKGKAVALKHHVALEETIYTDRYLKSDSPKLADLHAQARSYTREINALQKEHERLSTTDLDDKTGADVLADTWQFITDAGEVLGEDEDSKALSEHLKAEEDRTKQRLSDVTTRISELESLRSAIPFHEFDSPGNAYRLFAVFFHKGPADRNFGHYWVYIRDLTSGKWRKYNDEYVTDVEEKDMGDIFDARDQEKQGAATMVVYVRDDCIGAMIDPVFRQMPPQEVEEIVADEAIDAETGKADADMTDEAGMPRFGKTQSDGNVKIEDVDGTALYHG